MKEPTAALPNPLAQVFNGLLRRGCAESWGHGGCYHGNRGQNHWRVGRRRFMLVAVCLVFFCVVFYVFGCKQF
jgi:hypothetical protein